MKGCKKQKIATEVTETTEKYKSQKGAVLIICMIFLCIFTTLAVSMATMTDTNLQNAAYYHKADAARASAESGLEIIRFWLGRVAVSGLTPQNQVFSQIANSFQGDLSTNGITNITPAYDGSTSTITIPPVTLDSTTNRSFSAVITQIDSNSIQADITGNFGTFSKTISVKYRFTTRANTVFDFGVATKGPLSLSGNIELEGVNVSVESDVYIESESDLLALSIIGNSQIAGDVSIANPLASVLLQGGQAGIGGETGQDAIDNHVDFGVPPTEFPEPNPDYFAGYVQSIIDMNNTVFENVIIPAGTNPTFAAGATLKGITFIETPNDYIHRDAKRSKLCRSR